MQRINYIYPLLLFYFFFCNIFSQETLYSQARRIGESAFGWENDNDNVEEIILPASVTVIEKAAFYGRKRMA